MEKYIIGQKLIWEEDSPFAKGKLYKGTVKEVYEDHIIADFPEINDHCYFDKDNEYLITKEV